MDIRSHDGGGGGQHLISIVVPTRLVLIGLWIASICLKDESSVTGGVGCILVRGVVAQLM